MDKRVLDQGAVVRVIGELSGMAAERKETELRCRESYHKGYSDALDDVNTRLMSGQCDSLLIDPRDCIRNVFYELCKELDIKGSDIYDAGLSVDETASLLADRIKSIFSA